MIEDKEITAMSRITDILSSLEEEARKRILLWLLSREGLTTPPATIVGSSTRVKVLSGSVIDPNESKSLSDFFYSVDPQNDMERALTVAAFLQSTGGGEDLSSQEINDELKHLGYPIANITKALTRAMEVTPRLMHQTRKEGTSQQARKKYRVTHEGMKYLQGRISRQQSE